MTDRKRWRNVIRFQLKKAELEQPRTMSLMRSPLARQRVMLSSRTVFMFSIHNASMGPSNTVHLRDAIGNKEHVVTACGSVEHLYIYQVHQEVHKDNKCMARSGETRRDNLDAACADKEILSVVEAIFLSSVRFQNKNKTAHSSSTKYHELPLFSGFSCLVVVK